MTATPLELSPQEVQARRTAGEPVVLIDVREPHEHQICRIEGATLIPMRTVPAHLQHLEGAAEDALVVVYCHHGVRSLNVAHWLRQQGVENVTSMAGGIDLWSTTVDPAVPRY